MWIEVANGILGGEYGFWLGTERKTVRTKPIIFNTARFCVDPEGRQQVLNRDDAYVSSHYSRTLRFVFEDLAGRGVDVIATIIIMI